MFKCKSCRHKFGANIPDQCPACGTKNDQPERSARGLMILLTMEAIEMLVFLIVCALIVVGIVVWLT